MTATLPQTQPVRRPKRAKAPTSVVHAVVTNVVRYRPHVQRITLKSTEFHGWLAEVPDQFITFLFPIDDRKVPVAERTFDFDQWFALPEDGRPHARNYSVRSWRPQVDEIDVDMIVHGPHGQGSRWAMEAEPGDALAIWGPRTAYYPAPNAVWQLLIADETGLPALSAILDHFGPGISVQVIAEVDSPASEYPLDSPAHVTTTWLHRGGPATGKSQALIDAVRTLDIPDEVRYAWGGAEFRTMEAIGKYLRREAGFRPGDVSMIGYW